MKRAEPGWLVLLLAAVAAFIGSFLPFYSFPGGGHLTVWSRGLFPAAALIPVFVIALGLQALFVLLMGYEPRSPFQDFTWEQARLAGGALAVLLALTYIVQDHAGGHLGTGYYIVSLSAVATFAGGVITRRVQLARAPGEEAPTRAPVWRPAVVAINRWRAERAKKVAEKLTPPARLTAVKSETEPDKEGDAPAEKEPASKVDAQTANTTK